MRGLILAAIMLLFVSGCFIVPEYIEVAECWECDDGAVALGPAEVVVPMETVPIPSPFEDPVVTPAETTPAKTATPELDGLALRPSPYDELSLDDVEIIDTYRVEFRMGRMTIRGPGEPPSAPPTPPPSKSRRTKRSRTKVPAKVQCPAGCIPAP